MITCKVFSVGLFIFVALSSCERQEIYDANLQGPFLVQDSSKNIYVVTIKKSSKQHAQILFLGDFDAYESSRESWIGIDDGYFDISQVYEQGGVFLIDRSAGQIVELPIKMTSIRQRFEEYDPEEKIPKIMLDALMDFFIHKPFTQK